jgi:hypothetical protein
VISDIVDHSPEPGKGIRERAIAVEDDEAIRGSCHFHDTSGAMPLVGHRRVIPSTYGMNHGGLA